MRLCRAAGEVVHEYRDRFGSVTWRLESREPHVSELDDVAGLEWSEAVFGLRRGAEVDRGAGAIPQLQVPGEEVGVKMGQEHVPDVESVFAGEGDVQVDVA